MLPRLAVVACLSAAGLVSLASLVSLGACTRAKPDRAPDAPVAADASPAPVAEADASADAGRGTPRLLAAMNFTVSVCDRPAWPESDTGAKRLGYLRNGAVVEAYDKPIPNDDCTDGWYELVQGGYVCGKAATFDRTNPRVRLAPKQPDRDAGMPYTYGVNLVDGTPLYRRVLKLDDRKKYEPELDPPKPAEHDEAAEAESNAEPTSQDEGAPSPSPSASASSAVVAASARLDAGAKSAANDKDADAGKPRLKDLKGRGVLVRKMVRGFYVALDRDFKAAGARWWRTTYGFAVPYERMMVQKGVTKYHGAWFEGSPFADALAGDAGATADASVAIATFDASDAGDGGAGLAEAVGFVVTGYARELRPSADGKRMIVGPELSKRTPVLLTGRAAKIGGVTYHETAGGFFVRLADLSLARPEPPADLGPDEKWIDVDLTRQALVAFEGTRPVFATRVSSGRRNTYDKEKDFPTPTGTFHIREKHLTTTMDGDVASDGPYSIEDVPWVMYFQGSYALHGAFWHDSFGHKRSHGCVNLAPDDARTLFAWTDPPLPPAWHGVFAQSDTAGTRVVLHEDETGKK